MIVQVCEAVCTLLQAIPNPNPNPNPSPNPNPNPQVCEAGCTLLQGVTLGRRIHHHAADPARPITSASLCGEVLLLLLLEPYPYP